MMADDGGERGLRSARRDDGSWCAAGRALQIARELQQLSQSELARRSGISQSAISAIESDAKEIGLKRARVLADVLGVHPAVIAFPDYEAPVKKTFAAPAPRFAAKKAAKKKASSHA